MRTTPVSDGRPDASLTCEEKGYGESGPLRSAAPGSLSEADDQPLTPAQWALVLEWWPQAQEKVRLAADLFRRRGAAVDPDQMESDALFQMIDAVRILTDAEHLKKRLRWAMYNMVKRLKQSEKRRRTTRLPDDFDRIAPEDVQSPEEYLSECGFGDRQRHLLLKRMTDDPLTPAEQAEWREMRPSLRTWAHHTLLGD
jgi:hypothetical protein